MIINKNDIQEMILNSDEFVIKTSLEIETINESKENIIYNIDNVIIDFKNQDHKYFININEVNEEIYKIFDYFLDVHQTVDIIKHLYNIELLQYKKSDFDQSQKINTSMTLLDMKN